MAVMRLPRIERITIDPCVMSGQPCIRGMRITVTNILRLLAAGHDKARILKAYPWLESEDITACIAYGAMLANERIIEG